MELDLVHVLIRDKYGLGYAFIYYEDDLSVELWQNRVNIQPDTTDEELTEELANNSKMYCTEAEDISDAIGKVADFWFVRPEMVRDLPIETFSSHYEAAKILLERPLNRMRDHFIAYMLKEKRNGSQKTA